MPRKHEYKVRQQFDPDESRSSDLPAYEQVFLCEIVGIGFRKRGVNDDHICFELMGEDDGRWFPFGSGGSSSFWFSAYSAVLEAAEEWCRIHAIPDMHAGAQFGWKLKRK